MHPFRYLSTVTGVGKNKIVYVKNSELKAFADAIEQYKRIKEIIEELRLINTNMIKGNKSEKRQFDTEWREPKLYTIYEYDENGGKGKACGVPGDLVRRYRRDVMRN